MSDRVTCYYCSGEGVVGEHKMPCPMCYGNKKSGRVLNEFVQKTEKKFKFSRETFIKTFRGITVNEDDKRYILAAIRRGTDSTRTLITFYFMEALFLNKKNIEKFKLAKGSRSLEVRRYENIYYNSCSTWHRELDQEFIKSFKSFLITNKHLTP